MMVRSANRVIGSEWSVMRWVNRVVKRVRVEIF